MEVTKNKLIQDILKETQEYRLLHEIIVTDYWDADLFAVGLQRHNTLIYLTAREIWQKRSPLYYYDIEDVTDPEKYCVIESGVLSKLKLIELIKKTFA